MNQKQIWNKIAPEWSKFRQKPMKEILDFLENKKGKILDLGCGSGRHLIKKSNLKFYEVDFSKEMIKFAKENAKKKKIDAEFFVSSSEKLPFGNNFFDSAIYIAALHCVPSEKSRKKSLDELFRILKSKSEAIITVWSKSHVKLKNKEKNSSVSWKNKELQRYYYLYDLEELENLLKKSGFKVLSIKDDRKNIIATIKRP